MVGSLHIAFVLHSRDMVGLCWMVALCIGFVYLLCWGV